MIYRVNYGNGQVSGAFSTKYEASCELRRAMQHDSYAFIQRYEPGSADEPGDWFTVTEREQARNKGRV